MCRLGKKIVFELIICGKFVTCLNIHENLEQTRKLLLNSLNEESYLLRANNDITNKLKHVEVAELRFMRSK